MWPQLRQSTGSPGVIIQRNRSGTGVCACVVPEPSSRIPLNIEACYMALHSWPLTSDIDCLQGRICSSGCCRRPRDAHNLMCLYGRSAWSWCGSRARQVQSSTTVLAAK